MRESSLTWYWLFFFVLSLFSLIPINAQDCDQYSSLWMLQFKGSSLGKDEFPNRIFNSQVIDIFCRLIGLEKKWRSTILNRILSHWALLAWYISVSIFSFLTKLPPRSHLRSLLNPWRLSLIHYMLTYKYSLSLSLSLSLIYKDTQ